MAVAIASADGWEKSVGTKEEWDEATEALRLAAQKLPISTKIITRADQEAEVAS